MKTTVKDLPSSPPAAPLSTPISNLPSAEQLLWQRFRVQNDVGAREALLLHYAYLVRFVIGRMKVRLVPTLDFDDLQSAGAIGLIKAVDRFDPEHGVKFETYAYRWIQGHVLDYVRQLDVLSRTSRDRVKKFKNGCRELRDQLGRDPSESELLAHLSLTPAELDLLYFEMGSTEVISLQATLHRADGEENGESREDFLADEREREPFVVMARKELTEKLQRAIDELPTRERQVISLYYFEDLTLKEIGEVLGVSESRICQIHSKAVLDLQLRLEAAA